MVAHFTSMPLPMVNVSPSLTTVFVPGDCLDPPYALTPECAASFNDSQLLTPTRARQLTHELLVPTRVVVVMMRRDQARHLVCSAGFG